MWKHLITIEAYIGVEKSQAIIEKEWFSSPKSSNNAEHDNFAIFHILMKEHFV